MGLQSEIENGIRKSAVRPAICSFLQHFAGSCDNLQDSFFPPVAVRKSASENSVIRPQSRLKLQQSKLACSTCSTCVVQELSSRTVPTLPPCSTRSTSVVQHQCRWGSRQRSGNRPARSTHVVLHVVHKTCKNPRFYRACSTVVHFSGYGGWGWPIFRTEPSLEAKVTLSYRKLWLVTVWILNQKLHHRLRRPLSSGVEWDIKGY